MKYNDLSQFFARSVQQKMPLWEKKLIFSDGDFGKYFHLPVSVNFGKWIIFTGKLPVNQKNQLTPLKS
jgi:hypothetical protein